MRKGMRLNPWLGSLVGRYCSPAIVLLIGLLVMMPRPYLATAACYPTLVGTPTFLIVDQTNTGATTLILRNQTRRKLEMGVLSTSDFISQITGLPLGARSVFTALGVPQGAMPALPPGGTQLVKVEVSNLWEGGESTADLLYNGEKIRTLKALKYPVPFGVGLQGVAPDNPVVTFEQGLSRFLILKNEDFITYPVHWELAVAGKKAKGGPVYLHPKMTAKFEVVPETEWFAWYRGIFKEDLQDGLLTLSYPDPKGAGDAPPQVKTIPLKARLFWSPFKQQLLGTVAIFVLLFLGGVCSLLVGYWVPNRLRRRDLLEQLEALAGKIRDLSHRIDSSLRVLVRVQRYGLREMLRSRWTLSPDLANVFAQCTRGIATLTRQVALLGNIDRAYLQLREAAQGFSPPSLLDRIEDKLRQAKDCLRISEPEDTDFQAAQALITDARTRLAALHQADPDFAKELADRVNSLIADLDPTSGIMGKSDRYKAFRVGLPDELFNLDVKFKNSAGITLPDYPDLDTQTAKLMVIKEYLTYNSSTIDQDLKRELVGNDWEALLAARQLVQQVREAVLYQDIEKEIKKNPPEIKLEPSSVRPYLPVRLSASFAREAWNHKAAREGFTCHWVFDSDSDLADLEESGWEVSHYFTGDRKEGYQVKVSFKDKDGQPVLDNNNKQITAPPPRK